jgi:predicted permease
MRRDMRYAVRALIKSPSFAVVGIISTGLGMGLTTMVYNSKWQLISQNLPAATNAERVEMIEKPVSYYYIEQFRDHKNLFTGVAAFQTAVPFNVTFQGDANAKVQRVFGQLVSADYFAVLGVPSQRGRVFSPELDKAGDGPVVVISDRFWRNRLNSAPDAVGRTIWLNRQLATIVGITPKGFNGALALNPSELFVPITVPSTLAPELANDVLHQRDAKEFLALLCLAPGTTVESAETALDTITHRLDEQEASAAVRTDKGRRVSLLPAGTTVPIPRKLKPVVKGFYVVLMGLIMTIACMNLANMLFARGANRRKELAIRMSIGATRFRLVRQMISEGIVLAILGGIAGFILAYLISLLNSQFVPPSAIPIEPVATPDWHVAVFVFALAIICGIGFSAIPALRATKVDVTPALKEGSVQQLRGYRRLGLRNLLMVTQVSGSLMLLLITGFLVVGITQVSNVPTKFDPHTMYLVSLDPVRDGYTPEKSEIFFEKVYQRLKTIPSVSHVVMAAQPPFSFQEGTTQVTSEDSQGAAKVQISAVEETVGAGYFDALSEPMLVGREFTDQDQRNAADRSKALPVVLNQTAALGLFGNGRALGGRIRDDKNSYEVVGVVHDLKNGLAESQSVIYLPLTQRDFAKPPAGGITVMVRSDSGRDALEGIRQEISFLDPNVTVFNVRTLSAHLDMSRSYQRFALNTYAGIGLFGLILSAIGLAGITAYAVAQRRKEIGIRMALGARKGQVLLLVLREGTVLVIVGTVLGFLGAFGLAKMLSALTNVFVDAIRVGTDDPRLLVGAPLLLAVLALLACYVPALRATKVDPIKALREG